VDSGTSYDLSAAEYERFAQVITERLGIRMPEAKLTMLQGRLSRRIRQLGLSSFEAYRQYLFRPPHAEDEYVHFIDAVTTNKTDFFREAQSLDYLVEHGLPSLAPSGVAHDRWHGKVWCAGCSSGEEAWTLAMVLSDYALRQPGFDFSILATDISTKMLSRARNAVYRRETIEPVPAAFRKRYLLSSRDPARGVVRVVPALRAKVEFGRLNFMDRGYAIRTQFDVIFFRNVMIYFDKPTQEAVVNKLCRHLRAGGYLFVGRSESLMGLHVPVRQVALSAYRKHM